MKCKATIRLNDHPEKIINEVLSTEGAKCSTIRQFTNGLGTTVDDESTGPDCDRVEEITND